MTDKDRTPPHDDVTLTDLLLAQIRDNNPIPDRESPEGGPPRNLPRAPEEVVQRVQHHIRATNGKADPQARVVSITEARQKNGTPWRRWPTFLAGAASAAAVFALFTVTDVSSRFQDATDASSESVSVTADQSAGSPETMADMPVEESAEESADSAAVMESGSLPGESPEADGDMEPSAVPQMPGLLALPQTSEFAYSFDASLFTTASAPGTDETAATWLFDPAAVFSETRARTLARHLGLDVTATRVNNLEMRFTTTAVGGSGQGPSGTMTVEHSGNLAYATQSASGSQDLTPEQRQDFTEAFAAGLSDLGWVETEVRLQPNTSDGGAGEYRILLNVAGRHLDREIIATFAGGQLTSLHGQFFAQLQAMPGTDTVSQAEAASRLGSSQYLSRAYVLTGSTPADLDPQGQPQTSGGHVPRVTYQLTDAHPSYLQYGQVLLPAYTFHTAQGVAWQVLATQ